MEELFTGWIELDMTGNPGSTVTLQISTNTGKVIEYNMQDQYTFGPSGRGTFCNRFSYHEIHFVTILGLSSAPTPASMRGYRIGTDRQRQGSFQCTLPLLSMIYERTMYNYEGLTTGGMTVDCPHRERLGYGGDGHTSMEAAMLNYPSQPFFSKWAQDWADIQEDKTGYIAHTAPTIDGGGGPAWSGFIITMPWQVYLTYGDVLILKNAYPHMVQLLQFFDARRDKKNILQNWGSSWDFLGDWLTPHGSEESDTIEAVLFNNCYVLYCTRIVSQIAAILGDPKAAQKYAADADTQAQAIVDLFFNPSAGTYLDSLQTHLVLPLISKAVPADYVALVENNLRHEIAVSKQGHLDTGLHGTYFLTKYLIESGQNDVILTYALQTTFPSYGYFLAMGYTTWPEDWHGALSRMHGCYNSIGSWFQSGLLGVSPNPLFPGFQQFTVRPGVEGLPTIINFTRTGAREVVLQGHSTFNVKSSANVFSTRGNISTMFGQVEIAWSVTESNSTESQLNASIVGFDFHLSLSVPLNSAAVLYMPTHALEEVFEGNEPATQAKGVQFMTLRAWNEDARGTRVNVGPFAAVFRVGSGDFNFRSIIVFHG